MSTKHRNAGGPFTIFNPGLGVSGSLKVEQSDSEGRAVHVSGSMSIMPKFQSGQGFGNAYRHMLEIAQKDQYLETLPGGIAIHGANGLAQVGDGYGAMGVYSGSASSPREFVISSGVGGSYSTHLATSDINFVTSGTDNETQRVKISQYPALQVTGSFQNNGNASITGSLNISGQITTPSQPFDSLTKSTDTTIFVNPNYYSIQWNSAHVGHTPSGNYNSVTATYTASHSGVYFMVLNIAMKDIDASVMDRIQFKVETALNGGGTAPDCCFINFIPQEFNDSDTPNNDADAIVRTATAMMSVTAGSTFKVVARKSGGANTSQMVAGGADGGGSFWQIRFMG